MSSWSRPQDVVEKALAASSADGQVAPVSHGCPTALFQQTNILNTKQEGGR